MAKIATVPAGANGLLFHPYLLGERAPLWNAEASASFTGLRKNHHAGHLARAVVEGICFNLKTILEDLKQLGGPVQEGFGRQAALLIPLCCMKSWLMFWEKRYRSLIVPKLRH